MYVTLVVISGSIHGMHWWNFLFFIGIAWGILLCMHYIVYAPLSRVFNFTIPHPFFVLSFCASCYFLAGLIVRSTESVAGGMFYYLASVWLGVLFLLFSVLLVYGIVHVTTGFDSRLVLGSVVISVVCVSVYAVMQGRVLVTKEYTIPLENSTTPIRIVHLSDIHVGTVHGASYLAEVVQKTNELNPDLILITGDLFDGSAPIQTEMLLALDAFTAPAYFSNGNHDTLETRKLQLLENEFAEEKGIQIVGVNDRQSLPRDTSLADVLEMFTFDTEKPTVLMYHSPLDWEAAQNVGVDLMLSGHTHNGQIYPFNVLVRMAFKYMNGLYEEQGKYLHVSPGTGTWGPPMRLGSRNQITLLHVVPKE